MPSNSPSSPSAPDFPPSLDIYSLGRPPFLVRNLRYVRDDKTGARARHWDLNWVNSASHALHLTLTPLSLSPQGEAETFHALNLALSARVADGREYKISAKQAYFDFPEDAPATADYVAGREHVKFDLSVLHAAMQETPVELTLHATLRQQDGPQRSVRHRLWRAAPPAENGHARDDERAPVTTAVANGVLELNMRGPATVSPATLRLYARGRLVAPVAKDAPQPPVVLTLRYSTPHIAGWQHTRHDFMCPWCSRDCRRFRTLLSHFQLEHDDLSFALHSMHASAAAPADDAPGDLPAHTRDAMEFNVQLDVTKVNNPEPAPEVPQETFEEEYVNPVRYVAPRREAAAEAAVRNRLASTTLDDDGAEADNEGNGRADRAGRRRSSVGGEKDGDPRSDSDTTDADEDVTAAPDSQYLAMIRDRLWAFCSHCSRRHDRSYNGRADFCSEWCELRRRSQRAGGDAVPMASHSSTRRPPEAEFERTFRNTELFHVVSMAPVCASHIAPDDPDSEEEVDHSWRLKLVLERVRAMEEVDPKVKALMMLWDSFVFNNEPVPSQYGERYTRYTLELFALECAEQIRTYGLRLQLMGFLRALHIHGLIDSIATKSVFLCLDGKQKRRDLSVSRIPEQPVELSQKVRSTGRGRRGRRNMTS